MMSPKKPDLLQVVDQEIIDVDMDENSCNVMLTEGIGTNYKGKVICFVYETCSLNFEVIVNTIRSIFLSML